MITAFQTRPWRLSARMLARAVDAVATKRPAVFTALVLMVILVGVQELQPIATPLRAAILGFAALSLVLLNSRAGRGCFAVTAALIVFAVAENYFLMANHAFVIAYFAVLLALIWHDQDEYWANVELFSKFMLATLMGVALIQKLTSMHYMSGNLMADLILTGQIYYYILPVLEPNAPEIFVTTIESRDQLMGDHARLSAGQAAALPALGWALLGAIYLMTLASVFMQGLLEYLLIFERRYHIWLHRLIFVFVLAVYSLRDENVFLSLNCVMGYALTDERSAGMRIPYVLLIAYLLITSLLGYRPMVIAGFGQW